VIAATPAGLPRPRYLCAGDTGLVVEFGNEISEDINRRVHDLARYVEERRLTGVVDLVPTYRSLLVTYDPLRTTISELEQAVAALEAELGTVERPPAKVVEIPTAYGGEFGPDLAFVAEHAKLHEDEVVRIHAGPDYLVYMMGFTAGFPYLGGMSPRIAAPRLKTPRTSIPAGSVGIAQQQTGIYPADSPGGWQIIGRTPVRIFDPACDPPVAVEAGNYVRFMPIEGSAYQAIEAQVRAGTYRLSIRVKQ